MKEDEYMDWIDRVYGAIGGYPNCCIEAFVKRQRDKQYEYYK